MILPRHTHHHSSGPAREATHPTRMQRDFSRSPLLVFWEITRACPLACRHCRACAMPQPHPNQLDPSRSKALLSDLAEFPEKPIVVLTGGDPMMRPDLLDLINHGRACGLTLALAPSATPFLSLKKLAEIKHAGINSIALSLDGADAASHDGMRGEPGVYDQTMKLLKWAHAFGMHTQVNTTVMPHNLHELPLIADQIEQLGASMWSLFFLVPTGRGLRESRLTAEQYEQVFHLLYQQSQFRCYQIKTTEAHHYRRYVMQQQALLATSAAHNAAQPPVTPRPGIRDGQGVMFISHVGQFFPSGFLPLEVGRYPADHPVIAYQDAPLMTRLRDADQLQGKCGRCRYRQLCGGSRARAYAVTGDPMAAEPDCLYQPV